MQIDLEDLRRHYESLTDDELLEIEPSDLTDQARGCYEWEMKRRKLTSEAEPPAGGEEDAEEAQAETGGAEADPDWLETAVCACSYVNHAGDSGSTQAENAAAVLEAAGIPCEIEVTEFDPPVPDQPRGQEYRVMVPGALNLKATSILDKEIFNPQMEADWRSHLSVLTDADLQALTPDVICAGMADRIARLKRVYQEEIARRKMK